MPSKKKGPSEQKSKKALAEAKRIRAADQTFGIKNKGKSAKAKQYVSRVEHSLTGNEEARKSKLQDDKKAKRALREAEEREERALFSETTDVLKGDKKKSSSVARNETAEESAAVQKALTRAKELFDAGAMSMDDYVSYREQILAADEDSEEEDEAGGDKSDGGSDDDDAAAEAEPEEEPEPEPLPDPRLSLKVADLYLEGDDGDVDLAALPDDDAE
mmetsp:Transcript_23796/g.74355  ORF Transcript_23796/g.74355 Transcript_23796/m.74355 type:complete len:217 (+) Transcript_23796:92-742(+)